MSYCFLLLPFPRFRCPRCYSCFPFFALSTSRLSSWLGLTFLFPLCRPLRSGSRGGPSACATFIMLPGLSWLPRVVHLYCLLTLLGPIMFFRLIDFVPRFLLPLLAAEICCCSMIFNLVYLWPKMKRLGFRCPHHYGCFPFFGLPTGQLTLWLGLTRLPSLPAAPI
jgi:hypothetical protein